MRSTPHVRQLSLLLAASWLAAVAPQAGASEAALSASPVAPAAAFTSAATSAAAFARPAALSGFDAVEEPDPLVLAAANSFTHVYLTPASFSRVPDNDSHGSRLHLPRQDPNLQAIDPYASVRSPVTPDDDFSLTGLWISGLGLLSATISGILLYARNPISRKRKYRNKPGEPRRK